MTISPSYVIVAKLRCPISFLPYCFSSLTLACQPCSDCHAGWLRIVGTYILGCERGFSQDNNILIIKMLDAGGTSWSAPVKLTEVRSPRSRPNHAWPGKAGLGAAARRLRAAPYSIAPTAPAVLPLACRRVRCLLGAGLQCGDHQHGGGHLHGPCHQGLRGYPLNGCST